VLTEELEESIDRQPKSLVVAGNNDNDSWLTHVAIISDTVQTLAVQKTPPLSFPTAVR
jgi:hypothetical protein